MKSAPRQIYKVYKFHAKVILSYRLSLFAEIYNSPVFISIVSFIQSQLKIEKIPNIFNY